MCSAAAGDCAQPSVVAGRPECPAQYPCWEALECSGEVPQSRSGHTCALHQNRYLYIFGGFDGSNCFDDLYVLDLESKLWRRIEASGDRPSGRASHSAVTDELAGVMYIFGGSGSHFGYTNKHDLCEFCFETETWRLLSNPLEDTPSKRYGQSMVAYKESLYVWGGTHGTNYPTDMHRFDLCSKQWDYLETTGDLPCGRYRHQAMVKDDLMYIVGGSGINRYGDVFTFHFGTNVWRKLICTGTDLSDGRYAHSAVLRDGYMYLYGGNDGIRHDDLQQLDLETRVWSRVTVHGHCPPGRDFHAAVLRRNSMVIFGGSNGMHRHNDVFEFHMAPKTPACMLQTDLEALLDQAQTDEATQMSCDVFLAADSGESSQGIYCHSHLLRVRCPVLYEAAQECRRCERSLSDQGDEQPEQADAEAPAKPEESAPIAPPMCGGDGGECSSPAACRFGGGGGRPVVLSPSPPGGGGGCSALRSSLHSGCAWVALDIPPCILSHLCRYLYAETTKFGRLSAEQLYRLFLVAQYLEVPRLAALCERQIKVRLGLTSVLPLLRASARDGDVAKPVQDACKHFFLANYNQCTDLRECEALDPRLLCELMRLHNSRAAAASGQCRWQPRNGGGGATLGQPPGVPLPIGAHASTAPSEPLDAGPRSLPSRVLAEVEIPSPTLAADLRRLLEEAIDPDFRVVVQDEVIPVHKFVLVARSRYFASCILTSGMVEAQAGRLVIPDSSAMTAEAFRAFLRFLYAGDDILNTLAPHTAMYLVDASSFYGLTNHRLKDFCERCVRNAFNEAHVLQLFDASSRLSAETVRKMALDFIIANFHTVCQQPALESLDKPLLIEIIKGLAEKLPPGSTPPFAGGCFRSAELPRNAS
mmetsp:Transcript_126958/g.367476  ORF Transcript_126958/g.367476 Transcript_126958/m.367476 type:complete len:870 (+) Transcript_126958:2-2611(+)